MSTVPLTQGIALAAYLEKVLAGEADLENLLDSPEYANVALASCFHGLQHYLADESLRQSDLVYRQMQEREMRLLISCLREGASTEKIGRISFLQSDA